MFSRALVSCRGRLAAVAGSKTALRATSALVPASSTETGPVAGALGSAPPARLGGTDVEEIRGLKSSDLRRLAEAAAAEGASPEFWGAIADRCEAHADQLHYWDIVLILQASASARVERRSLLEGLGDALCSKTSRLAPKHILDAFAVYEAYDVRPRALYVELFHAMIRLSPSMYAEELSMCLQALARHRIGNPTVLAHLVRTVRQQLGEFRLRYLCGAAGALGALQACPVSLMEDLDRRARFEVETVAVQELLENLQAFPLLEFSWRPYEELCREELIARVRSFETWRDVEQLADPFEAYHFLQAQGLLDEGFLNALCQWCLKGVHRPNVRSHRRPTSQQLALLHDRCFELGLESAPALQDAIQYYVESGGGKWQNALPKPLRFSKRRCYFRTADPLEQDFRNEVVEAPRVAPRAVAALPGLPEEESWEDDDALEEAIDKPTRVLKKPSAGDTVNAWSISMKLPRPRRSTVGGPKRTRITPIYLRGGWRTKPKYFFSETLKRWEKTRDIYQVVEEEKK